MTEQPEILLKSNARKIAIKKRQQIDESIKIAAAKQICDLFEQHVKISKSDVIACYYPLHDEISSLILLENLSAKDGIRLCLPKINIVANEITFRSWQWGDELQKGPLGIMEPAEVQMILEPDIVIVPIVAFNKEGYRLGYGGGYYDRGLAKLRLHKNIVAVGLAFEAQKMSEFKQDPHDQIMDMIITEQRVYRF